MSTSDSDHKSAIDGAALCRAAQGNCLEAEVTAHRWRGFSDAEITQAMADAPIVISPLRLKGGDAKRGRKRRRKTEPPVPNTKLRQEWRSEICAAYRKTVEAYIETGTLLVKAKVDLDHGEFERMIHGELPFKPSMARKLMAIATHPILSDRSHENDLPPCWTVLYELSQVDRRLLEEKITDGTVNPRMERKDAAALRTKVPSKPRTKAQPRTEPGAAGIHLHHVQSMRDALAKVEEESAAGDEGLYRSALEHLAQVVAQAMQATEQ
jgi:hypothetical protein